MQSRVCFAKEVFLAVMVTMTAWTTSAYAQLPGGGPIPVTAETPGDYFYTMQAALADLDTVQIPLIVQSLTVTEGQGQFSPVTPGGGVQVDPKIFPGWTSCAPDCMTQGRNIDATVLNAYQDAMMGSYGDQRAMGNESQTIAALDDRAQSAKGVLTVLKAIADLEAMNVQEQQHTRQAIDDLRTITATHYAEQINAAMQKLATQNAIRPGGKKQ